MIRVIVYIDTERKYSRYLFSHVHSVWLSNSVPSSFI